MPEEYLKKWKSSIKKEWKIAFISTVLTGFLTHVYVMTNMLPNHDGLINIYNTQLKFKSGRFFLGPFSGISSFFDLPWIIGSLAIFYLALMNVVLVEIFELKKTLSIVLLSGIIITFPTVGSTFAYMFTADGYMAGNLLAVLAILVTKKWRFGFVPASLIFYVSVGIYQANLNVFIMVAAVWFIRELLMQRASIGGTFRILLRQVAAVSIGMILYAVTFKMYQRFGGEIVDYQGLTEIGVQSGSIFDQFIKIKNSFFEFFFRGMITDAPINLFEVLNVFMILLLLIGVLIAIVQNKVYRKTGQLILVIIGLCMLPIFAFILYFVSPGVSYHMLMVMSVAMFYVLPISIYDNLHKTAKSVKWFSWGTVVISSMIIFNFAVINNIAYFNMSLKYEKSYALVNRILDRMEQTEGFEEATQLAVIGRIKMHTEVSSEKVVENIPMMIGAMGEHILAEPYHYEYMLANQFGKNLTRVDADTLQKLLQTNEVQQMDVWPAKESVQVVDDIVIIKLSES